MILIEDGLDRDALTGSVRTDDGADLILCAQTLGNVDRFLRITLGIVADELDLLAEDAAFRVLLLNEKLQGLAFAGAVGRLLAGEGAHPAELDGVGVAARGVAAAAAGEQTDEHQRCKDKSKNFTHERFLLIIFVLRRGQGLVL